MTGQAAVAGKNLIGGPFMEPQTTDAEIIDYFPKCPYCRVMQPMGDENIQKAQSNPDEEISHTCCGCFQKLTVEFDSIDDIFTTRGR